MESLESVENFKVASFIVPPIIHVTPGRVRTQVNCAQSYKDVSQSAAKIGRKDSCSHKQPLADRTERTHCTTERLSGNIFQTEVSFPAKVEYTPIKRLTRESTPLRSASVLKIDSSLMTRSTLYSRSARRQEANLRMPKVEVPALSRGRSFQHL